MKQYMLQEEAVAYIEAAAQPTIGRQEPLAWLHEPPFRATWCGVSVWIARAQSTTRTLPIARNALHGEPLRTLKEFLGLEECQADGTIEQTIPSSCHGSGWDGFLIATVIAPGFLARYLQTGPQTRTSPLDPPMPLRHSDLGKVSP